MLGFWSSAWRQKGFFGVGFVLFLRKRVAPWWLFGWGAQAFFTLLAQVHWLAALKEWYRVENMFT